MADQDRSKQTDDDELTYSGMPEGEDDATPLGVDEDQEGGSDEEKLPGIATSDEPEVSG